MRRWIKSLRVGHSQPAPRGCCNPDLPGHWAARGTGELCGREKGRGLAGEGEGTPGTCPVCPQSVADTEARHLPWFLLPALRSAAVPGRSRAVRVMDGSVQAGSLCCWDREAPAVRPDCPGRCVAGPEGSSARAPACSAPRVLTRVLSSLPPLPHLLRPPFGVLAPWDRVKETWGHRRETQRSQPAGV